MWAEGSILAAIADNAVARRAFVLLAVVASANLSHSPWARQMTGACPPGVETVPGTWCRPVDAPTRQERRDRRLQ